MNYNRTDLNVSSSTRRSSTSPSTDLAVAARRPTDFGLCRRCRVPSSSSADFADVPRCRPGLQPFRLCSTTRLHRRRSRASLPSRDLTSSDFPASSPSTRLVTYDFPTSTLSRRLVIFTADFPDRSLRSSPTFGYSATKFPDFRLHRRGLDGRPARGLTFHLHLPPTSRP